MKNKRMVITGGAGFLGANLIKELQKDNEIKVIDNFSSGRLENIASFKNVEVIKGSVTNLKFLKEVFSSVSDVDYIFHFAAIVSIPMSIRRPFLTFRTNEIGTLNLLIAAKNTNVKKIVFSSSCAVYGVQKKLPITEKTTPKPISPYGISKLAAEEHCKTFSRLYGLPIVVLRYFNLFGPFQNVYYSAVIPSFVARLRNKEPPIIYGDGTQTRDFTYIKDGVRAAILSAEKPVKYAVLNVGTGKKASVNEVVKLLLKIFCLDLKPIYKEERKGDIRHSVADISNAKKIISYEPKYNLEEGLKEYVNFFR